MNRLFLIPVFVLSMNAQASLPLPPEPDLNPEEVNELIDSAPLTDVQKQKVQNVYSLSQDATATAKEGGAVSMTEKLKCKQAVFEKQISERGFPTNATALIDFVSDLSDATCE